MRASTGVVRLLVAGILVWTAAGCGSAMEGVAELRPAYATGMVPLFGFKPVEAFVSVDRCTFLMSGDADLTDAGGADAEYVRRCDVLSGAGRSAVKVGYTSVRLCA
ncbi:hypothetical protein BDB13_5029 [Rhodococcus sp. OK302]|nr:hypothetical protein BDB13_5029 [Rhodococcus sp. OK302]